MENVKSESNFLTFRGYFLNFVLMKIKEMTEDQLQMLISRSVVKAFEMVADRNLGSFMQESEEDEKISFDEAKEQNLFEV